MEGGMQTSSSAQGLHRQVEGSRSQLNKPADSARSIAVGDSTEALVVPKQAMAAALGPRHTQEADAESGDVPMPWWYTPRRLLVSHLMLPLDAQMRDIFVVPAALSSAVKLDGNEGVNLIK